MKDFRKVVKLGVGPSGSIFVDIKFDKGNLSITGVEGPKSNGDCKGSCGQILDTIREYGDSCFSLPRVTIDKFLDIWENWHLNDMRAGCQHQREAGWDEKRIDDSLPANSYGKHFVGQSTDSSNLLIWVSEDENSCGLLSKPCPVCGYKYGSSWLREEVPDDVIEFLNELPETDYKCGKWF